MWRKGNFFVLWVGMQISAASVESSMETPEKIKNGTAYDPEFPHLEIYLKKPKTLSQNNKHPYIHCSIIYNHQYMKAAPVSISR